MGILLLGGLALLVINKIKGVPRALIGGMGLLPTVGLAVHDFLKNVEVPDFDDLIVNQGPQGGLSGIVHTPRPMDPIIDMPGPGGMLSGGAKKKKKKTKYRNIAMTGRFEDEDPSLGPLGDHPVIGDQGAGSVTGYEEDSHGFGGYDTAKVQTEPKQIADTQIRTWGFGMFEDQFNW